jgi:hypothetical protein
MRYFACFTVFFAWIATQVRRYYNLGTKRNMCFLILSRCCHVVAWWCGYRCTRIDAATKSHVRKDLKITQRAWDDLQNAVLVIVIMISLLIKTIQSQLTCVLVDISEVVINWRFLGKDSEFSYCTLWSCEVSTGGALNVNTFLSLQFAVTVKLSTARNFGPLNVSLTKDSRSRHKLSHEPAFKMVKGNLACKGFTDISFRFEEKNILRLFWVWSVTAISNENGRPTGTNNWKTKNFWVKNKPCLSSLGNCIFVVVGSPSKI